MVRERGLEISALPQRLAENDLIRHAVNRAQPIAGAQLAASVFGLDYEGKPMKRDFVMKSPREKQSLERAVSSTLKQD